MNQNSISVISNRRHITLLPEDILYIQLIGRKSVLHVSGGKTYETYTTMDELAQALGSSFIRADRACLVAAKAIHTVGKKLELINGESLDFAHRRKREIKEQLRNGRRQIVRELSGSNTPATREEYQLYYSSFDHVPLKSDAFSAGPLPMPGPRIPPLLPGRFCPWVYSLFSIMQAPPLTAVNMRSDGIPRKFPSAHCACPFRQSFHHQAQ